jgi:hypothetical protein
VLGGMPARMGEKEAVERWEKSEPSLRTIAGRISSAGRRYFDRDGGGLSSPLRRAARRMKSCNGATAGPTPRAVVRSIFNL